MKATTLFTVALLTASIAAAQQAGTAQPAQTSTVSSSDQALLKAARENKTKRKKSSTKVITNADVKKSKGKLMVIESPEKTKPLPAVDPKAPSALQAQDANYKARTAAEERFKTAQAKVDDLQDQLDRLERRYYEENDPNYRDHVIQQRFGQVKNQLETAQHELADARDALDRVEHPQK